MKISWNWLQDYIQTDISIDEVAVILTSIGLEVEAISHEYSIKGGLEGFVIGRVMTCEKHPDADKLKVTTVDLGANLGVKNIVCGAPNVAQGQTVVVATEGTTIYPSNGDSFVIKASKIRGEMSQGMICAEDEMGIGESHEGIMVLPESTAIGTLAKDYFNISSDIMIEIGLTPNRTDAMSHQGVARDLATALSYRNIPFQYFPNGRASQKIEISKEIKPLKIEVNSPQCPIFYGVVLSKAQVGNSPQWLKDRLTLIGEHPKNNLVDISNFVMHDTGHPIHLYDYDKIKNATLLIDTLSKQDTFESLINAKFDLQQGDILIRDSEKALCLAGIVGANSCAITDATQNVLLECAYFDPTAIRQTSERIGFKSEAASKYEKGVDPNQTLEVLTKSMNLIAELSGAVQSSEIIKCELTPFEFWNVTLTHSKLNLYAGREINGADVDKILNGLGIEVVSFQNATWTLKVPRYKQDVTRDVDVIEEILRISSYDKIPYPKFLKSNLTFSQELTKTKLENKIANMLSGCGYSEIMTNSISQSKYFDNEAKISLLNSMTAELDCMRTSMIPGFLEVMENNINRGNKDLAFFEFGSEYFKNETYSQKKKLILSLTGFSETPNWTKPKGEESSYIKLKSIVEKILNTFLKNSTFQETSIEEYAYAVQISSANKTIGTIAALDTSVLKKFDIKQEVFVAEIDMDSLFELVQNTKVKFKEISKFPTVKRDLALIVDESTTYAAVESICKNCLKDSLAQLTLFDVFKDPKLGENKKSYAIRITLQHNEKTMTDIEIEEKMTTLIQKLNKDLKAELRM